MSPDRKEPSLILFPTKFDRRIIETNCRIQQYFELLKNYRVGINIGVASPLYNTTNYISLGIVSLPGDIRVTPLDMTPHDNKLVCMPYSWPRDKLADTIQSSISSFRAGRYTEEQTDLLSLEIMKKKERLAIIDKQNARQYLTRFPQLLDRKGIYLDDVRALEILVHLEH
jgi:hypothetical protein